MMQQPILLGQVLGTMLDSQRLLVIEDGQELYRGYVANFKYSAVDRLLPIKEISLAADIFPKAKRTERLPMKERVPVPMDSLTDFEFSDLECVVYQKIILEKSKK